MRVEVYWNLHKHCWSVRAMEGVNKGRVIEHTDRMFLAEPKFIVQKGGQRQVRQTGQKAVHAFVRGHILPEEGLRYLSGYMEPFTYNPYRDDTFVTMGEFPRPIQAGDVAILGSHDSKPKSYVFNAA